MTPGPNQESVWDYPRPPRVEPSDRLVTVLLGAPPGWRSVDPVVVPMSGRARGALSGGEAEPAAEDFVARLAEAVRTVEEAHDGFVAGLPVARLGDAATDARRKVEATVEYLRSTLGDEAWAKGMNPDVPETALVENPYQYSDYGGAMPGR